MLDDLIAEHRAFTWRRLRLVLPIGAAVFALITLLLPAPHRWYALYVSPLLAVFAASELYRTRRVAHLLAAPDAVLWAYLFHMNALTKGLVLHDRGTRPVYMFARDPDRAVDRIASLPGAIVGGGATNAQRYRELAQRLPVAVVREPR